METVKARELVILGFIIIFLTYFFIGLNFASESSFMGLAMLMLITFMIIFWFAIFITLYEILKKE